MAVRRWDMADESVYESDEVNVYASKRSSTTRDAEMAIVLDVRGGAGWELYDVEDVNDGEDDGWRLLFRREIVKAQVQEAAIEDDDDAQLADALTGADWFRATGDQRRALRGAASELLRVQGKEITGLKQTLKEHQRWILDQGERIAEYVTQIQTQRDSLEEQASKIETFEQTLSARDESLARRESLLAAAVRERDGARRACDAERELVRGHSGRITELALQVRNDEERYYRLNQENLRLRRSVDGFVGQEKGRGDQVWRQAATIRGLQDDVKELEGRLEAWRGGRVGGEREARVASLEEEVARLEGGVAHERRCKEHNFKAAEDYRKDREALAAKLVEAQAAAGEAVGVMAGRLRRLRDAAEAVNLEHGHMTGPHTGCSMCALGEALVGD